MEALLSIAISLLFLGLFFWAINSLSVLRLQMEDVIARLERMERGRRDDPTRNAT
jgi:hypothetical protein